MDGLLKKHIDAIADAMMFSEYGFHLGVVEGPRFTHVKMETSPSSKHIEDIRYLINNIFKGCGPNRRIALVYLDQSQTIHHGAWRSALQKFCTEDITGVFVLEEKLWEESLANNQSTISNELRERLSKTGDDKVKAAEVFLSCIPDVLWKAEMPIFFDECGVLSRMSPSSEILTVPNELSFEDLSELESIDSSERIAFMGCWMNGHFPVYEATNTPEGDVFAANIAANTLEAVDMTCRHLLGCVDGGSSVWTKPLIKEGIEELASFLNWAIPGTIDTKALCCLGCEKTEVSTGEYAVSLDTIRYPDIKRSRDEALRMRRICELIKGAFDDNHVLFNASYPKEMKKTAVEFGHVLRLLGIPRQIEVLKDGVPFEDIVA